MKDKISVIVPCYNEEASVELFYETFKAQVSELFAKTGVEFEVVFVDDGSSDSTHDKIRNICACQQDPKIADIFHEIRIDRKYLSFSRNFGKEAAMYAGFKAATGNYVAVMDVDLQDPPFLLKGMYDTLALGEYDCVATRRSDRRGEAKLKSWLSDKFYDVINKISEVQIVNGARDYRLMNRKMVDSILALSEKTRFSKGLFCWVGFKTKWIEYENVQRSAGTTKWNFVKLFRYALDGIFGFSSALLRLPILFSVVSFLSTIICLICGMVQNNLILYGLSLMSLFFGLMFVCLWVFGEYISIIHKESRNRPIYIVRDSNIEEENKNESHTG